MSDADQPDEAEVQAAIIEQMAEVREIPITGQPPED
jgi:hypothetical protein